MGDESPMNYGKRYIRVRGGVVHDDPEASHTAHEYIEPDRDTFTGLYDHEGHELHRQREPIGYDPHRWAEKPAPRKTRARKTR